MLSQSEGTDFLHEWVMLFPVSQGWEAEDFKGIFVAIYFVVHNQTTQFYYIKTPYINQLEHTGRLTYLTVLSQVQIYCQH